MLNLPPLLKGLYMTITLYECLSLGVTIDEWSSLSIVDRNQHIRPVYFNIKESTMICMQQKWIKAWHTHETCNSACKKNGCLNEKAAELASIIHDFNMTIQLFDQASWLDLLLLTFFLSSFVIVEVIRSGLKHRYNISSAALKLIRCCVSMWLRFKITTFSSSHF